MPTYEYACEACGHRDCVVVPIAEADDLPTTRHVTCATCGHERAFRRRFAFSFQPPMHEHFNKAVSKPIHSMRQFKDELKRKSEEATLTTGIEHNYKPIDMADTAALGVTNEGIDESNRSREAQGAPLLPEIKAAD